MADGLQAWHEALSKFRSQLGKADRDKLDELGNLDSLDSLVAHIDHLQLGYSQKKSSTFFRKLKPTFEGLWGFNASVQSFIQASPQPLAFTWGSLSLILQISLNYTRGLELLVDCLRDISDALPRINLYNTQLAQLTEGALYGTLVKYHVELLGFCNDAAFFFSRKVYRNLLRSAWKHSQSARLTRISKLLSTLDQEANLSLDLHTLNIVREIRSTQLEFADMFLGAIPYQNLPGRNYSFFGREGEIDEISHELSRDGQEGSCKGVSLYGLAGSGKTQLALEYAYRKFQSNFYQAVLWVSAETESKLAESFATIARGLGLLDDSIQQQHERQKQAVIQWLIKRSRPGLQGNKRVDWLIVFDNASDPSLVEKYWPHASGGSVIVTCRNPEIAERFSRMRFKVESFDQDNARKFLFSVLGSNGPHTAQDISIVEKIAEAVGNHPLALNLVGSHIRCCGKTLGDFVREHPDFERNFIFRQDLQLGREGNNERSVSDAFALNSGPGGLYPLNEDARLLMNMLAFLDPDGAPLELFMHHTKEAMLCDGPDDPDNFPGLSKLLENPFDSSSNFDVARRTLLCRSLISMDVNKKNFKCHRLVRIATERNMTAEDIELSLNKLVFFLNSAFPSQVDGQPLLSQWERCDEFASSVVSVLDACMRHRSQISQPVLLAEVVCRCSWYYYEQGRFTTATRMADQAIAFCEHILESRHHPGYTTWYVKDMISHQFNTKGAIGMKIPNVDHGLSMYEEALALRVRNRREGNEEDAMWIGAASGNLAVSLMAAGKAEAALPLLLELVQREDMKTNEDLYWSNLCLCLSLLGCYEDSLLASKKAEECILRHWSQDDVRMASVMFYVSNVLEQQGDNAGALDALKGCLSIRQDAMRNHPETGLTMHRMGVFLARVGKLNDALHCLLYAVDTLRSCECHPGAICRTLLELGVLLERTGDAETAKGYFDTAELYRQQIVDIDTTNFAIGPSSYDRFVTVGLR